MRLFLGLPSAGSPAPPFLESLARLRLPAGCTDVERYVVTGNFIPGQRELIATEALQRGYDVIVMIDDDIVVAADALEQLTGVLAQEPRTAVAGALYYSRDGLRPMAVADWDSRDTTAAVIPAFTDAPVTVEGVGFGCVAIRAAALAALDRPLFSAHIVIERLVRRVRIADEDYVLCERLRGAGFEIRLHAGVRCGHYDRQSGVVYPRAWEDPAATAVRRMYVRTPDGETLVPAQDEIPRAREEHQRVSFDYVSIE
ncbi:MAG: glycosyltransferase [Candidatus Eremiobacteraeota bacterium]|nr:glycosyltransferase [Candidatus Eremiobacteraeota bacterium]MBV8355119.1 glycosyltransferase [Candidatus Eremiobacteraeota bacterium]